MSMAGDGPPDSEVDIPANATLRDIVDRHPPAPWIDGDNIPWNDPEFSRRMLHEHLTDEHDLASRRPAVVDAHVARIHAEVLDGQASRILDLACGPGLYLNRLARLGHHGVGIDFSPASIEYAREIADLENLPIEYLQRDIRTADFGTGFDLAMMLYGQLNVFRREKASDIVDRAAAALGPGGSLVLEVQTTDHLERSGEAPASWSTHTEGLFSNRPHLLLQESMWDDASRSATERFWVIDAETGVTERHALTSMAYSDDELIALIESAGLRISDRWESFLPGQTDPALTVWIAEA